MADLQVEVPPHIAETIHAIALLHAEHHRKSTVSERIVDRATTVVGRPTFLLTLLFVAALWVGANALYLIQGGSPLDR